MKAWLKKCTAVVCLLLVLGLQAAAMEPWELQWELKWTVDNVKVNTKVCSGMQGMSAYKSYVYTAKVSAGNTYCVFTRTGIDSGKQTQMTYYPSTDAAASAPCTTCGHANDLCYVDGKAENALYVATGQKGTALTRLLVKGTKLYDTGYFELLRANGKTKFAASSIRLVRQANGKLYFLIKNGMYFYACVLDETATGGTAGSPVPVVCPRLFEIDTRNAQFYRPDGSTYRIENLETWVNQGYTLDAQNGTLYVPLSNGGNDNALILYDAAKYLDAAVLTRQEDGTDVLFPCNVSFRIQDPTQREFEIESCDFRKTGNAGGELLLYFNNNASLITTEGVYVTNYAAGSLPLSPIVNDQSVVYTVRYRVNGGSENTALNSWNAMNNTRHIAGVTTNLRPNTFLPPDSEWYFSGWTLYRASDKKRLYQTAGGKLKWYKSSKAPETATLALLPDKAAVTDLSAVNGDTINATAQWVQKTYTVTFDAKGGTVEPAFITLHRGEAYGTLPTPKMDGFVFGGWYLPNGTPVTETTVLDAGQPVTLTALWTPAPPADPTGVEQLFELVGAVRKTLRWTQALLTDLYQKGWTP